MKLALLGAALAVSCAASSEPTPVPAPSSTASAIAPAAIAPASASASASPAPAATLWEVGAFACARPAHTDKNPPPNDRQAAMTMQLNPPCGFRPLAYQDVCVNCRYTVDAATSKREAAARGGEVCCYSRRVDNSGAIKGPMPSKP